MKYFLVISLVTLTSCGVGDGSSEEGSTTILPNGATQVTHGSLDEVPTLRLVEQFRIGDSEEPDDVEAAPYIFGDIRDFDVDDAGNLYVLDYQAAELRLFDRDARFIRNLATRGSGPGELARPNGARFDVEGNLWVSDPTNARITVYGRDLGIINEMEWRVRSFGYSWMGGGFDGRYWDFVRSSPDLREFEQTGVVTSESESFLASFGEVDVEDTRLSLGVESGTYIRFSRGAAGIPFQGGGGTAFHPSGLLWRGGEDAYSLARMSLAGDTTLVVKASPARAPVTDQERRDAIDRMEQAMERFGPVDIDWGVIPREKPTMVELVPDDQNGVWVRRDTPGGEVFDVFDAEGRYRGSADVGIARRSGVTPVVHADTLWAKAAAEDGTPIMVRLELESIDGDLP